MPKLKLLTYSDAFYADIQKNFVEHVSGLGIFDEIITKTREDLVKTQFYAGNKEILDMPRGGGYHIWKPYYIFMEMLTMEEGDAILFMDCDDWIYNPEGMKEAIMKRLETEHMILTIGGHKNSDWTKRDCFTLMDCDTEKYHNAPQLESGICVFKKCIVSIMMLNNWILYCNNRAIVTDEENTTGPNYEGFKEHRHDQSVLTNLHVKYELYASHELRDFIVCDKFHKDRT